MAAAAARKLQKDIEVVLKKGHEGTEEFAELWDQMASASTGPQKERLGEELKKCINKLQRLRSQMRDWLGSSAVQSNLKDKLEEGRKVIENDMSRFKDFEREFKTKAFSGAGLAKMDELDLEEAEKLKYQDWLTHTIQVLKDQLDQFEADAQLLSGKKNQNSDEKQRLPKLQRAQETSRWHIKKLEQLLRAVNNDACEITDLAIVKDSIELYVEAGEDSDCYHDDQLYDCFDLTEYEEKAIPKGIEVERLEESASSAGDSKKAAKEKQKKQKWDKKWKDAEKKKAPEKPPPKTVSKEIIEDAKFDEEVKVQEDQLLTEREEFICKICQIHVVGCRPKLTSCSHLFCGDCIAQWFDQHPDTQTWAQRAKAAGPDRRVPCPVCKKTLNENHDLVSVSSDTQRGENVLLWRMLSGLRIMCVNNPKLRKADGKCDWTGEYGNYQKHIEVCKNVPLADADYPPEAVKAPAPAPPAAALVPAQVPAVAKHVTKAAVPAAPQQSPSPMPTPAVAPKAGAPAAVSTPAPASAPAPAVPVTVPSAPAPAAAPTAAPVAPAPAPSNPPTRGYEERRESREALQQTPMAPLAPAPQVAPAPVAPVQQPVRREEPVTQYPGAFQGLAVSNFEPTGVTMVPVRQGDLIEVLETHHTGWSYAKNLSNASIPPGWVPSWIVGDTRAKDAVQPQPEVAPPRVENKTVILQNRDRDDLRPAVAPAPAPAAAAAPRATPPVLVSPTRDFLSGSDSQMTLSILDQVEIVERHSSGWTFGRKMQNGASVSEGWFPDWACPPS